MERGRYSRRNQGVVVDLLVIFSLLISFGFPGQFTEIYGDSIKTLLEYVAFIVEIALLVFCSANKWQDIELLRLERKYLPIYLYVAVNALTSLLVSFDRRQELITVIRWAVTMQFVLWMVDYFSREKLLEIFCTTQAIFLMLTLYFMIRHPNLAYSSASTYENSLNGLFSTKNTCATQLCFGITMMVLLIRLRYQQHKRFGMWTALLLTQVVLLFMCDATGALFTQLFAFIPLFFLRRHKFSLGLLYITVNVVFLFAMLTLMPLFEEFLESIEKDATLTGRIPLWEQVISVMSTHNTLTGYGYCNFWRNDEAVKLIHMGFYRADVFMATMASGAHNVIMEAWLNSGLIGITVFFIALLMSFRDIDEMDDEYYAISACLIFFLMINGLTERCLGDNYDYRTVALFLAMGVGCSKRPSMYSGISWSEWFSRAQKEVRPHTRRAIPWHFHCPPQLEPLFS